MRISLNILYQYPPSRPHPSEFILPVVMRCPLTRGRSYDTVDYYEIDIKPVDVQIYPKLNKTRHVGYDGIVPGPTFMMEKGKEAVVRFVNHADRANSVHLHGSYSMFNPSSFHVLGIDRLSPGRAPFDGWAEDTTEPGQYKGKCIYILDVSPVH